MAGAWADRAEAEVLLARGDDSEAATVALRAADVAGSLSARLDRALARELAGRALVVDGQLDAAAELFELAAQEFDTADLPVVHYLLGELYRRLGESKKAREHFERLDEFEQVEKWLIDWRDKQLKLC